MTLERLAARLGDALHRPGSKDYARATTPYNAVPQHPVAVAAVAHADDVGATLQAAHAEGLRVYVQSTGHAAARELDEQTLLIDTGAMTEVRIEPARRVARVGAGAVWSQVQHAAFAHGLLGLSGSAGSVGVAGYVFGGGIGWLTRPHGMASASLRAVDYVDGSGRLRRAAEDATDEVDIEALWAFRGGGGVGVATAVEIDLVPGAGLWGGTLFYPAEALDEVAARWAVAARELGAGLSSAITALVVPPVPAFPEDLHGRAVVRVLAVCSDRSIAPDDLRGHLDHLPAPLLDTFGTVDDQRLGTLHADPPGPVSALGDGYWLTADAFDRAADLLGAAGTPDRSALNFCELRHVGVPTGDVPGALTVPPGPVLMHGNGGTGDAAQATESSLADMRAVASQVGTGYRANAFCDGRTQVPDAFDDATRERLRHTHDLVDPAGVIDRPRTLVDDAVRRSG